MVDGVASDPRQRRVLLAAAVGMFAINVDFFAVQATLPPMAEDLDTTVSTLQWVISGYMLALASFLIVAGRLADIFGRKTFYVAGAIVFGVSSLLAGAATGPEMIIIMRIVQGLGAAVMMPVGLAIVTNAFPADRTQRAVGLVFAIAAVGQAMGPLIGGALTEWLSWRWVLWVNVPITVLLVVLAAGSIEQSRDDSVPKVIDWSGLVLVVASIGTFTYGIDKSSDWGWASTGTIALTVAGAAGLVAFVLVEARVRHPLLDLTLFRIKEFSLMIVAGAIGNMGIVTAIFLSMLFLQDVEGMSTLEAGTAFLAFSLAVTLVDQFAGRLERFPSWLVMAAALAVGGGGGVGMAVTDSVGPYLLCSVFAGAGYGLSWAYASVVTQDVVPAAKAGEASGTVLTVLIGLGGVAIAVASSVVAGAGGDAAELGEHIDRALLFFGVLCVAAAPVVAVLGRRFQSPIAMHAAVHEPAS
jgi:EmrB/QacA subfamily drug resistance transporter